MNDFIKRVTAERLGGDRPGAPRALGAAAMVGTATAVLTYKLLRK
jgi:hypothetical protein